VTSICLDGILRIIIGIECRNREAHISLLSAASEHSESRVTAKWERELDYALRKNLWGFAGNRIAVRFQYESHDADGQWFRSYGNEL